MSSKYEWRVSWSASSTIAFSGASEWEEYDGDATTEDEIREELESTTLPSGSSIAEETFWQCSGAEWSLEVREVAR